MDWQKSILQKDIIFTINDHISDNSIQINIKFIFTIYEYTIVYECIRYIYIYIYIYMFFIYCNIVLTYTHTGHTGFTIT